MMQAQNLCSTAFYCLLMRITLLRADHFLKEILWNKHPAGVAKCNN
jgi:hypothetical protein